MIKMTLVIMIADYVRFNTYEVLTISDVLSLRDGDLMFHRSTQLKEIRWKQPYMYYSGLGC